jgi:hypothetical protein
MFEEACMYYVCVMIRINAFEEVISYMHRYRARLNAPVARRSTAFATPVRGATAAQS